MYVWFYWLYVSPTTHIGRFLIIIGWCDKRIYLFDKKKNQSNTLYLNQIWFHIKNLLVSRGWSIDITVSNLRLFHFILFHRCKSFDFLLQIAVPSTNADVILFKEYLHRYANILRNTFKCHIGAEKSMVHRYSKLVDELYLGL